jgi:flagellar hook-associated protein 1 FlgK
MALSIGLDSAIKALRAHQMVVDVASHNIANAQTPGFSRQRVLLRPDSVAALGRAGLDSRGRPGSGVAVTDIQRVRDTFLDFQARMSTSSQKQYEALSDGISQAELTFNEPSDNGISALLSKFFNAWHDVGNDPESPAARTALVHAATDLTANVQRAYSDIASLRGNLDQGVRAMVDQVNSRAGEIATLNQQIVTVEATGQTANDLRDRRDTLVDELAQLGQVSYVEQGNHALSVYFGNHELVNQSSAYAIAAVPDQANPGMNKLVFSDGADVTSTSGRLRGLLDARDSAVPGVLAQLDTLSSGLITQVNAVHAVGFGLDGSTGNPFFAGTGGADIAVDPTVANNTLKIAASTIAGTVGNSSNALAIDDLQLSNTMVGGTQTFEQYYGNIVSVLGADVSRAKGLAQANQLMSDHLEAQRQATSGVNIDEEVSNMTAAQHAYQAAARVITTIDSMLDTLINQTGVR